MATMLPERLSRPVGNGPAVSGVEGDYELDPTLADPADNGEQPTRVSRDTTVPVELVDPDPDQPRQHIDKAALTELAESIAANGLAVPILVRPAGGRYLLVHGERRWRAVSSLGWESVPAEIRVLDDDAARWLQLAENIGRADLSPIEEATAFRRMLADGSVSRDTLAARLGKSKSYVSQKLRLLDLPAPLTMLLDRRALSEGHVRQLLRIRGLYTDAHTIGAGAGEQQDDQRRDRAGTSRMPDWPALDRVAAAEVLLQVGRPEDWPSLYPHFPWGLDADDAKDVLAADAAIALHIEMSAVGSTYPAWPVAATYFAGLAVWAELSVADLHDVIDRWVERLHAAVIAVNAVYAKPEPPEHSDRIAWLHWWGHRSDLRHGWLLNDHKHLVDDALRSFNTIGAVIAPSNCQWGGNLHDEYQAAAEGGPR